MLAKLIAVILVIGSCGGGLLAMRQSRLQAAHEIAAARWRIERQREELSRVRANIAERTTPEAVRLLLAEHPELAAQLMAASERRGALGTREMDDAETGERVEP